jgi:hypothetical protein
MLNIFLEPMSYFIIREPMESFGKKEVLWNDGFD